MAIAYGKFKEVISKAKALKVYGVRAIPKFFGSPLPMEMEHDVGKVFKLYKDCYGGKSGLI